MNLEIKKFKPNDIGRNSQYLKKLMNTIPKCDESKMLKFLDIIPAQLLNWNYSLKLQY